MQGYLFRYFNLICAFVYVIGFEVTDNSEPFRSDRHANRGGMLYVREDIHANLISEYAPLKMPLN